MALPPRIRSFKIKLNQIFRGFRSHDRVRHSVASAWVRFHTKYRTRGSGYPELNPTEVVRVSCNVFLGSQRNNKWNGLNWSQFLFFFFPSTLFFIEKVFRCLRVYPFSREKSFTNSTSIKNGKTAVLCTRETHRFDGLHNFFYEV